MTFTDWNMIAANTIKLKVDASSQAYEQVNAFFALIQMSKENNIVSALIDFSECQPLPFSRISQHTALHIAQEMRACPLHFLALVESRGSRAWWRYVVPSLRAVEMRAKRFECSKRAASWLTTRGVYARRPVGRLITPGLSPRPWFSRPQ